ncbi:glycosyltransferase involved in cell wall biosynthesis [Salinibacter ruber]|uniref:glycosyltransferase n=1 Tax=Salinibacter ruber TaxID=146919 RepID=UPI002168EFA8|nr:glycosyltransferase [Salinibacter ruber]MCS3634857.1 glycosyltransferase involved in cell wall biosynthesis [Salinibacter ruber]MCS3714668.1 glycosyltransferase involved in cell wall biosynthesis [Salinibacter ruber]
MRKKVILTLLPYYLPISSTGPVQTIASMVCRLSDEFCFKIITSNCGNKSQKKLVGGKANKWIDVEGARVYYASRRERTWLGIYRLIHQTEYNVLYLNTFWHSQFGVKPLLLNYIGLLPNKPLVLAPRGQFSPGAINLKAWKKYPYVWMAKNIGLTDGVIWQASSQREKRRIKQLMGGNERVVVAKDLPSINNTVDPDDTKPKNNGKISIIFLSRIVPKKNLKYAINILRSLDCHTDFTIVGPIEDEKYWQECKDLMSKLPKNINVYLLGGVDHDSVLKLMSLNDLFFLPTVGENYGHVIQEALSAGTPVLISDQTPWRNLETERVGWDLSLDRPERFRDAIRECIRKGPEEYRRWRKHIIEWEENRRRKEPVVEQNRKLFREALST